MERSSILRFMFIILFGMVVTFVLIWLWKRNQYINATATPAEKKVWWTLEKDFLFFIGIAVFIFVLWQMYSTIIPHKQK